MHTSQLTGCHNTYIRVQAVGGAVFVVRRDRVRGEGSGGGGGGWEVVVVVVVVTWSLRGGGDCVQVAGTRRREVVFIRRLPFHLSVVHHCTPPFVIPVIASLFCSLFVVLLSFIAPAHVGLRLRFIPVHARSCVFFVVYAAAAVTVEYLL